MEVIDWRTPRGIARLGCVLLLVTSLGTIDAAAQEAPDSTDALTVDQAVQLALANNRNLKIVSLSLDSSKQKLLADKTKRLPAFNTYVFASQLLEPISFTVQAGQFGSYPGIGPIPATNTNITTPSQPRRTSSPPPLSRSSRFTRSTCTFTDRSCRWSRPRKGCARSESRLSTMCAQAYYSIVEIQNAIAACEASIKQYKELDRITAQYVAEQVALKSENLEVKAKLADEQYKLLQYQDKLASAKESLNNLLGRDINTQFHAA